MLDVRSGATGLDGTHGGGIFDGDAWQVSLSELLRISVVAAITLELYMYRLTELCDLARLQSEGSCGEWLVHRIKVFPNGAN